MTLEFKKYTSRFTKDPVTAVFFDNKGNQFFEIVDWVIDNGGRGHGEPRQDGQLDLKIYEAGIGMVTVKLGEWVVKTDSGFEVTPPNVFTQMYEKVDPVIKLIKKPEVMEAVQFTGDLENESELKEWFATHGHTGAFRHTIPGTTVTYYRVDLADGVGSIDIPLGDWVLIHAGEITLISNDELVEKYQRVV